MTQFQLDQMALEFYGHDYDSCDADQKYIVRKEVERENANEQMDNFLFDQNN
jgi:hypothetical protein